MELYGASGLYKNEQGILINPWGEIWGYCRVSTKDQNTDRQENAMLEYGVDPKHIFIEHESGKNFNRPLYKRLIRVVRKGDIIVIKSIDRLGRNYQDIIDQWRLITQDIGCGIHVLDMPTLNTSGNPSDLLSKFITDMMLQVLSFVAQNERENTLKRQKEGMEAARKRGTTKIGRPKIKMPFEFWEVYITWKTGKVMTKDMIAYCREKYGMCQRTFYRRIRELDQRFGDIPPDKLRDLIVEDDFYDGIEFSMERCENAIGIYNPYINDPKYERDRRQAKKLEEDQHAEQNAKEEEEEIKRIILEKRQMDFKDKFGINDDHFKLVKRGRIPTTQRQKQTVNDAHKASTSSIKTVIVD